jgi:hypothetical protein
MSLSVIGAGLPRTGTMSLKLALEQLGFGRCYHMAEVFQNPSAAPLWELAAESEHTDWDAIFEGYHSTTDAPGCLFYRQIADYYPNAKLILTLRDASRWFESTQATILSPQSEEVRATRFPPAVSSMLKKLWHTYLEDRIHDREHMVAIYERHNAEVKRTIAPERLLVYEVQEGWEPLCRFLEAPVPDTPFPRINTREQQRELRRAAEEGVPLEELLDRLTGKN